MYLLLCNYYNSTDKVLEKYERPESINYRYLVVVFRQVGLKPEAFCRRYCKKFSKFSKSFYSDI